MEAASIDSPNSTMNIIGYSSHDIIADRRVEHLPPLVVACQAGAIAIRSSSPRYHIRADLLAQGMRALEPAIAVAADAFAFLPYHLCYCYINYDPPVSYLHACFDSRFLNSNSHTGTIQ
jgi:hypothetical protein